MKFPALPRPVLTAAATVFMLLGGFSSHGVQALSAAQKRATEFQLPAMRDFLASLEDISMVHASSTLASAEDPLDKRDTAALLAQAQQLLDGAKIGDDFAFPVHFYNSSSSINYRYSVRLKDSVPKEVVRQVSKVLTMLGLAVGFEFEYLFTGFVVQLPKGMQLPMAYLRKLPWIESMTEDLAMYPTQVQELDDQLWGLDRLDQARMPLDRSFTFDRGGRGVNVYILDSGIDVTHAEFGGRAKTVYVDPEFEDGRDCTGHGTHVAGIVAGTNVGVAKLANIHSLRVVGCKDGSTIKIKIGLEFVLRTHVKPAIVNLSLGPRPENGVYPRNADLDDAIAKVIRAGIAVFAAAGNDNLDGCTASPAGSPGVITVGASNQLDNRASFSNFGSCVSFYAPGIYIVSAKPGGGYADKQGTSQASPFVVGIAATYLESNPNASPAELFEALRSNAASGVLQLGGVNSPNLLAQAFKGTGATLVTTLAPKGSVFPESGLSFFQRYMWYIIGGSAGAGFLLLLLCLCLCFRRFGKKSEKRKLRKQADPRLLSASRAAPPPKQMMHQPRQLQQQQQLQMPIPMPPPAMQPGMRRHGGPQQQHEEESVYFYQPPLAMMMNPSSPHTPLPPPINHAEFVREPMMPVIYEDTEWEGVEIPAPLPAWYERQRQQSFSSAVSSELGWHNKMNSVYSPHSLDRSDPQQHNDQQEQQQQPRYNWAAQ